MLCMKSCKKFTIFDSFWRLSEKSSPKIGNMHSIRNSASGLVRGKKQKCLMGNFTIHVLDSGKGTCNYLILTFPKSPGTNSWRKFSGCSTILSNKPYSFMPGHICCSIGRTRTHEFKIMALQYSGMYRREKGANWMSDENQKT